MRGHCLCFGSPPNPAEQTAGLRLSYPEKGSRIDSDIAPVTEGGIWESCLKEASIELSSKEYRSYLSDEIIQWPVMRMPYKPGHRFLILSYRGWSWQMTESGCVWGRIADENWTDYENENNTQARDDEA